MHTHTYIHMYIYISLSLYLYLSLWLHREVKSHAVEMAAVVRVALCGLSTSIGCGPSATLSPPRINTRKIP